MEDGTQEWSKYLKSVNKLEGEHYALIEFVKDDLEEQFLKDAQVLKC